MNARQRKISWTIYFGVFLAVLRELIHNKDSGEKFSWFSVVAEIIVILIIGCFFFFSDKKGRP
jgi:fluoride ion exporter CrcB/FEX